METDDPSHKPSWLERLSTLLLREPEDREELVALLHSAFERNLLDAEALAMIEGVLEVSELAVRDVMVPRSQMDVVSVDDAGDVGKTEPDVYLLAASRLGIKPSDCTVFEDLLVGMRSAKSVGMHVWAMHDDSSDADWPEICDLADGVMFDFHDAPVIL